MLEGVKKLVTVYLKDLSHKFVDLGPDAEKIETLAESSLFRDYLCYAVKEKQETKVKDRTFYKYIKNFGVINIQTAEKVWDLPDCEDVFYKGTNAAELDEVEFIDRKIKLRAEDEPETEWESDDEDGPALILDEEKLAECEDPDSDPEDHTDIM